MLGNNFKLKDNKALQKLKVKNKYLFEKSLYNLFNAEKSYFTFLSFQLYNSGLI